MIKQLLEQLYEAREAREKASQAVAVRYGELLREYESVLVQYNEYSKKVSETGSEMDAHEARVKELEAQVKEAVLAHGATIKGSRLQAVWSRGRPGWDTKGLTSWAKEQPGVKDQFYVCKPTVSIREVSE